MLSFRRYLSEAQLPGGKLKHLEHNEDHFFEHGADGFEHADKVLSDVHKHISGKSHDSHISTKYDGAPSIIWGHHPESGKFFVGSKSVFNKDPKVNYSHADIDKHHGHAPGLVSKLKLALDHLPKVTPNKGVFQGDLMHDKDSVTSTKTHHLFKPNTITYSIGKHTDDGKAISKSKIGVVAHTQYHGKALDDMHAKPITDHNIFQHHPDVHMINPTIAGGAHTEETKKKFKAHMDSARALHKQKVAAGGYDAVQPLHPHLKTYINSTVRDQSVPSTNGFRNHVIAKGEKEASKYKTADRRSAVAANYNKLVNHIDKHHEHFDRAFKLHDHLQGAKHQLVNALSTGEKYDHSVNGAPTKPEGFVIHNDTGASKLVDRADFSRHNFTAGAFQKKKS